ncbi:MAG: tRNA pseudouridine(55) synthase TruB [Actinomycetota bacterium]|nr:tRNA pseudouridine(55) synthase TruB [Actinomycetota bacterium]
MTDPADHRSGLRDGGAPIGDGLLVVDKPAGWTSHDVVGRCRRLCRTRRVGHAGTLDPMATGVLVLGVNRATRLLTFLVGCDKTYRATIRLGQSTVTDDAEGEVTAELGTSELSEQAVVAAVRDLTGPIEQVPSSVSAIKLDGRRSYARVRAGEQVELSARPVTVRRFEVLDQRADATGGHTDVDVEVEVSSGTYVRALARDLGDALGVGGHLTELRRTRVGHLDLAAAVTLEHLEADGAATHLVPLADAAAAAFPTRLLTGEEAVALGHGRRIETDRPGTPEPVAAIGPDGRLVAVLDQSGPTTRSRVVFPRD